MFIQVADNYLINSDAIEAVAVVELVQGPTVRARFTSGAFYDWPDGTTLQEALMQLGYTITHILKENKS